MLRLVKKCGWSWARALTARNFAVSFAITPNPLCLKFMPDRELIGITPGKEYRSVEEAKDSPLSKAILSLEGVQKLMFGRDFVSVTKKEYADWESLKPKVSQTIDQYIDTYKPEEPKEPEIKKEQKVDKSAELEAVSMIKDLIEFRIRPMLLDDGGDIQYRGFNPKTGTVYVTLKGACEGCPSSVSTLKEGIERLLSFYVVEVAIVENIPAESDVPH